MTTPEEGYIYFILFSFGQYFSWVFQFSNVMVCFLMLIFFFHKCLAAYDVSLLIDLEKLPSAENEKGTNLFILTFSRL